MGFRYAWDGETRQFAHPAGLVVLTPEGRIARYLFGIEYAPKDLRSPSSSPARAGSASPVDQLLLYCYQYDPVTGRYGAAIMRMRAARARVLTVLALGGFVLLMRRREKAAARGLAGGAA